MGAGVSVPPLLSEVEGSGSAKTAQTRKEKEVLFSVSYFLTGSTGSYYDEAEEEDDAMGADGDIDDYCSDYGSDEYSYLEDDCYFDCSSGRKRSGSNQRASGCKCKRSRQQSVACHRIKAPQRHKELRKNSHRCANHTSHKDNVERRLEEKGLKRRGLEMYFRRSENPSPSNNNSSPPSTFRPRKTRPRSTVSSTRKSNEDHPSALRHELRKDNIPEGTGGFMVQIIDIQHREITAEDYELLLLLEDTVAPKTVSQTALESLEVLPADALSLIGELCTICMELFEATQTVKQLPCRHSFHSHCIDHWLSTASQNCPLDGLAIATTS